MASRKQCAIVVSIALLVAACASPGSRNFWDAAAIDALEADQPTSAAELADRAEVVVRGTITDVEAGPIDDPAFAGSDFPIVAIEITIAEVISGVFTGDTIKVIMPREATVSVESMRSVMPSEEIVVFAVDSGVRDYYATFSDLSVVTTVNDEVETALDPDATEIVTGGEESWDEVVEIVEEAASN